MDRKPITMDLDFDISKMSLLDLAQRMMVRKKLVINNNGDVATNINGIEFNTIGCNDENDFINKYQVEFEKLKTDTYSDDENDLSSNQTDELENELTELQKQQQNLQKKLNIYSQVMKGELIVENKKFKRADSFEKRIMILDKKITELEKENQLFNNIDSSELKKSVEHLNRLIDYFPEMNKEKAVTFYHKALESHSKDDVLKAITLTEQMEEKIYKKQLLETLNTMLNAYDLESKQNITEQNTELTKLKKEKEDIIKLKQDTTNQVMNNFNAAKEELTKVTEKIENLKAEHKMNNENSTSDIKISEEDSQKVENLPGSSSPTAMLPKNKLEDDYYKRLENAAKEGPIFHDPEIDKNIASVEKTNQEKVEKDNTKDLVSEENMISNEEDLDLNLIPKNDDDLDFDLTPEEYKPQIIQSVKKASAKLLEKIKNSKFIELTTKVIEKLRQHKVAALAVTSAAFIGIAGLAGIAKNNEDKANSNEATQTTEQTVETPTESNIETPIASAIETTPVETSEVASTPTEEETSYNEDLSQALSNILNSNSEVYTSADRAINDTNGLQPYAESWQNAEPSAYYKIEDNQLQKMTEAEANSYYQDGGNVAVRMDNNGTPIGYVSVDQQENTSSKSM